MLEKAGPDTQWLLFVISVQISSLGANEYEISKNKTTEICLKYFGTKIPQNSHYG
jgi:hypothetical protein